MKTAPTNWATIVASNNYTYECKINIAGVDVFQSGIYELSISGSAIGLESASIGAAIAGEINVILHIIDRDEEDADIDGGTLIWTDGDNAAGGTFWSGGADADGGLIAGIYIPKMASLIPYIRVVSNANGTTSDWLKMGEYFIDTREKDVKNGKFKAHGYDAMLKAEQTYLPSVSSGAMTTSAIVAEIATLIGVNVNSETTTILSSTYDVPYYAGQYTAREMLQYIGAAYYGSFIIDDSGNLKLIQLTSTGTTTDIGGKAKSLEVSEETLSYDKVVIVTTPTEEYTAGTGNKILEFDCPFGTQAMANAILSALSSYEYRGYSAGTALLTPLYELGDSVTIKGTTLQIFSRTLRFNTLMASDLEAPYSEEIQHEFIYKRAEERKIERLAANTASEFTIMNNQISSKVSQTDFNGNTIASLINQTATTVAISADKLTFDGTTVNINAGGFNVAASGTNWSFINLTYGNYSAKMNPQGFNMTYSTWNQTARYYNSGVSVRYGGDAYTNERGFFGFAGEGGSASLQLYDSSHNSVARVLESSGVGIMRLYNGTTLSVVLSANALSYSKNRVAIGTDSPFTGYNLTLEGSAMATGTWQSSSVIEKKTNVRKIDFNPLDVIENTDIYSFEYKADIANGIHNTIYGAIIGEGYKCDEHIMTGDRQGVTTYSMASILWLAVKELKKELEEIKKGK